jgi:hypothetical protein
MINKSFNYFKQLMLSIAFVYSLHSYASDIKIDIGNKNNFKIDKQDAPNNEDLTIVFGFPENLTYTFSYLSHASGDNDAVRLKPIASNSTSKTFKIDKGILGKNGDKIVFLVFLNGKKVGKDIEVNLKLNSTNGNNFVRGNTIGNDKNSKATGSILYDAMLMKSCEDGSNQKLVLDILSTYSNKKLNGTKADLLKEFENNQFLTEFITKYWDDNQLKQQELKTNPGMQAGADIAGSIASLTSSIGGLDVTNIADGFAKFIVKRTKQELSIAFFEKFKQTLDSIKDLQTVFPQTYRALSAIDKDIYMFQAYIQTLRESFEKDLASLPSNLPSIINNHKNFFDNMPELKAELLSGFYIAQSMQDKQHPGEIIENYPSDYWKDCSPNYQAAFNTLKLFSKSLKDSASINSYWATYADIKKLGTDNELLKIYLGLLELQAKTDGIVFKNALGTDVLFSTIIDEAYTDYTQYKSFITTLSFKTKVLESKILGLNKTKSDSLLFENYYSIVSGSIDLMKFSVTVQTLPHFPKLNVDLDTLTKKYFDVAQTSCDIAIDVSRRNYSSAVVNAIHLYDVVFKNENLVKYIKGLDPAVKKKEEEKYLSKKMGNNAKAFFKYASFMATIVQAKNSDDIAAAIEAFALPTGSARIKRESAFNVALNAYAGIFVGYECINGVDKNWLTGKNPFTRTFVNSWGVTAPIGISISGSLRKRHGSFSAFVSIIDIGALVSFRFANDTVSTIPNIQLKDIISPGIFLSWGIPKSPLSVNFGYQMGPVLRNVSVQANQYSASYSRVSLSLVVDLPLLNFYTRSKK